MNPKVHIVDDDEAIRDAVAFMLRANAIPSQCWNSGENYLADWTAQMRGCILIDVRMAGMTGLECFSTLQSRGNRMPAVFLTGHGDVPMAVEALRAGAFHFLEKPFKRENLLKAIQEALDRDAHCVASAMQHDDLAKRLATLSQREREVMNLILAGKMNKIIADAMSITMRTVEVHRANVFEKMGVRSAVELATLVAGRPII